MFKVEGTTITLTQEGREMIFQEKELVAILNEYFKIKKAQSPIENTYFEVNPNSINLDLFKAVRRDSAQEITRRIILDAFEEVKKYPQKYGNPFKTMIPNLNDCQDVSSICRPTVNDLIEESKKMGGHIASWVEQALEWAQRLENGESWKNICNDPDEIKWYRLVIWKDGYARRVGGASFIAYEHAASRLLDYRLYGSDHLNYTVPLLVLKPHEFVKKPNRINYVVFRPSTAQSD